MHSTIIKCLYDNSPDDGVSTYWKGKKLLLVLHTILSISNKIRIIWSEWLIITTSGMFSQQLVGPVASLVVPAMVSRV